MSLDPTTENLLRELAPQVLGALVRRYGHFDASEDAVQEALLAGALQWPAEGVPDNPRGWLIRVASRRLTDQLRSEQARRRREESVATQVVPEQYVAPAADAVSSAGDRDDTLILLFLCCHPVLTPTSAIALTLRAVGGLSTDEIARAFLMPEPTMSQRILRAKRQIESSGVPFRLPPSHEQGARLRTVQQALYLIFTEGHTATSGVTLQRLELTGEAIRLTRLLHERLPDSGEVAGLLALMLLTNARRAARTGAAGEAIPLAEQDRTLWDQAAIAEGVALVTDAMSRTSLGPYQLQAAIAAVHAEAGRADETDWPQIVGLYQILERHTDNPVVTLNAAVAVAMVEGPRAGLDLLEPLDADPRMAQSHRLDAVRAHLLELAGERDQAVVGYRNAARRTTNAAEKRYLEARAARLRS